MVVSLKYIKKWYNWCTQWNKCRQCWLWLQCWQLLKIADNFDDSIDDKVDNNIDILLTQCRRQSWRRCWQQFWLQCWRQCRPQFWRRCWQQCWKCWHCLMALLRQSDTSNDYKGKMVPPQIIIIMITKASMVQHQNDHNDYKGKHSSTSRESRVSFETEVFKQGSCLVLTQSLLIACEVTNG